jgi:hypothetical protein
VDDLLAIPFINNRLRHWQARLGTTERLEELAREALQSAALHLATIAASGESVAFATKEVQNQARLVVHYERIIQHCERRLAHYTERLKIETAKA